MISFNDIKLKENATYIDKLVRIVAREEIKLKMEVVPMVKVVWQQDEMEE